MGHGRTAPAHESTQTPGDQPLLWALAAGTGRAGVGWVDRQRAVIRISVAAVPLADRSRASTSACRTAQLPTQSRLVRSGAETSTARLVTSSAAIGTSPLRSSGAGRLRATAS